MERETWLKLLKLGDQVAVHQSVTGWCIRTIEKITPSGRFVLDNGVKCNANGYEINPQKWSSITIEELTEKILQEIEHDKLVSKANSILSSLNNINKVKKLSSEQLNKIINCLEEI
jgi:hypothetical protein